jgi:hypothetical protein
LSIWAIAEFRADSVLTVIVCDIPNPHRKTFGRPTWSEPAAVIVHIDRCEPHSIPQTQDERQADDRAAGKRLRAGRRRGLHWRPVGAAATEASACRHQLSRSVAIRLAGQRRSGQYGLSSANLFLRPQHGRSPHLVAFAGDDLHRNSRAGLHVSTETAAEIAVAHIRAQRPVQRATMRAMKDA